MKDFARSSRRRTLRFGAAFGGGLLANPNRGMPFNQLGLLTPSEVYAVVAYILNLGIIGNNQVMDAKSAPKVKMPTATISWRMPGRMRITPSVSAGN